MSSSRPHALYVAWGFPPSRGGGVYRALATANGLVDAGFDVTVLTADREIFVNYTGIDASLEPLVDPAIDVVRVRFDWPIMETSIRSWPLSRAWNPDSWRDKRAKSDRRDFPEAGHGAWAKPLVAAAERIHRERPVDLVIATSNPFVDFAPAERLFAAAGVPYVLDYRDAWTLDVFTGGSLRDDDPVVGLTERRLLAGAHEVWFVNEPIRNWHAEKYPEAAGRMHVVANGYDPEFAPLPATRVPATDQPLRFGYIGTLNAQVPIDEFAAGWAVARERYPSLLNASAHFWGYLGYYANPVGRIVTLFRNEGERGIFHDGPLAKAMVRGVYEDLDVLLLVLGSGRYVTSGKVFEYAASGLPIVSVHDPHNAASDVLRDYPLWFPAASLDPVDIASALSLAADGARAVTEDVRDACVAFARKYERDRQLSPRLQSLRAHVRQATAEVMGA